MVVGDALSVPLRAEPRKLWERARNHPAAPIVLFALASRVVVVIVAVVAGSYFPQHIPEPDGWNVGFGFTHWFARWDSEHYMSIAEDGYGGSGDLAWAFDPGYPLTTAVFRLPFPFADSVVSGFLISNACMLISVVLLFQLTWRLFDQRTAWRAAILLAVAPGTVYLSAVYAEALFLALTLGFFLALNGERWATASALAGLAAITRPPGLLLPLALVVGIGIAWHRSRELPRRAIAWAPLSLVPPGLFLAYSQWRSGDALISFHTRDLYWPRTGLHSPLPVEVTDLRIEALIYIGFAALVVACVFAVWDLLARRRIDALPVYAFSVPMAAIYFIYSSPLPILRYLLPVLPLYWAAAQLAVSARAFAIVVAASAAIAAVVTGAFATWAPLL
jgi:mannosyltransferase PIG-V